MREQFESKGLQEDTLKLIGGANVILEEYRAQGFVLTVRQLFYQFVSRGLIENTQQSYKRIVGVIGSGRLAGLIDWSLIEDRVRSTIYGSHWEDPAEIVDTAAQAFRIEKWAEQSNHVEVMVEKDALSGVLEPVCADLDVRFTANRGYSSLSHFYDIGKRIEQSVDEGKDVHVIYLGDHDPSGLDMDRDVLDRLEMFSRQRIEVGRLALTMDQIEQWNPPPNPAKMTDSRAAVYVDQFGDSSWELDAIEPTELAELVRSAVINLRDEDLWQEAVDREEEMRTELLRFAKEYRDQ